MRMVILNIAKGRMGKTSLIVHYEGAEYDVGSFVVDHPGGVQAIMENTGKDITAAFNAGSHVHSKFAKRLLEKYRLSGEPVQSDQFLDLDLPLVPQFLRKKYTKSFYLAQVHTPRHLPRPARFFSSPWLEVLTRTPWWVIPLVWWPVVVGLAKVGSSPFTFNTSAITFLLGLVLWTFIEYIFHRFFFHMTKILPDFQLAFAFHFLIHGVHHFLPMDRYRLVMPPALFAAQALAVWYGFKMSGIEIHIQCLLFAGAIFGYTLYDLLHYYFHHGTPRMAIINRLKSHHLNHHYKDPSKGFGVSSWFWDAAFGTRLDLPKIAL